MTILIQINSSLWICPTFDNWLKKFSVIKFKYAACVSCSPESTLVKVRWTSIISCKPNSGIKDNVALAKLIESEPILLKAGVWIDCGLVNSVILVNPVIEMRAFKVEAKMVKLNIFIPKRGPFQISSTLSITLSLCQHCLLSPLAVLIAAQIKIKTPGTR